MKARTGNIMINVSNGARIAAAAAVVACTSRSILAWGNKTFLFF